MGRRAGLALGIAALLSACGLAAGEEAADYGPIGSGVPPSTTTTTLPRELPSTTVMTLPPELLAGPEVPSGPTTTAVSAPFCFAAETFVFETTQMLLQETVGQALERATAGIEALDDVVGSAPAEIAGPATRIRGELAAILGDAAAVASLEAFEATALAMVQREAASLDSIFSTTAARCEVNLTEPNRPSLEGANNIAGA